MTLVIYGKNLKWLAVKELDDNEKIGTGKIIRLYNVGLNVSDKSEDYFDYIISFIYKNDEYFQLTCLSEGEGGNILCVLKKICPINMFGQKS